jgi:hypothetical protein
MWPIASITKGKTEEVETRNMKILFPNDSHQKDNDGSRRKEICLLSLLFGIQYTSC